MVVQEIASRRSATLLVALAAVISPAVHAQSVTDEIVVTAQRRAEKLDKVGLSVSAFSAEQMQALGLSRATDVAQFSPGVVMESTGGAGLNATLTVRGVAATDYSANQESPNAIYIDDVYVASSYASNFTFYDLERVEILRGPQGTLFGRNSTGGLANYITKKPTAEFDGYAMAGYGSYNQLRLEGAVGGPLARGLRVRLSGATDYSDGWWKNTAGKDTNVQKFWGLRGQISADLVSNFQADFALSYDKNPRARNGTYSSEPIYTDPATGRLAPLPRDVDAYGTGPGLDRLGNGGPGNNRRVSAFNDYGFLTKEKASPTLRLNWDINEEVSLTSLTNYTWFTYGYREDCDASIIDACDFGSGQHLDQWSEELRLSGRGGQFNWTAGIYYLNIKQKNNQIFNSASDDFTIINNFNQKVESISAFGQFDYMLSDKFRFTLGGRVLRDVKKFDSVATFGAFGDVSAPVIYDFSQATVGDLAKNRKTNWSGRIQIDYIPSDDALLYTSASRGVKGAGFNTNVGGALTLEQTPFKGERVYAYEAGAKLKLFNRKLRFNNSIFYYDYKNFQAFQFQGIQSFVTNNDAYMYGAESEIASTPLKGLDIMLGASYLKTKVKDVRTFNGQILDQRALNAPTWTVNGLIRKSFDLGRNSLAFQYSFSHASKRYSSVDNSYAAELNAATIHNARISYDVKDIGFEVAVFANNFTNTYKALSAFDYSSVYGSRILTYNSPRWFGIELRKDF